MCAIVGRTIESHGNLLGRHDLHGNGLLVAVQHQLLHARASGARLVAIVMVAVVVAVALASLAAEDGVEFAGRGGGFGASLFLLLRVRVKASEQVADDKVGDQGLGW